MKLSLKPWIFLLVVLILQSGCKTLTVWPAEQGTVVNQNGSPISGAHVVALWRGIKTTPKGQQPTCYHIETNRTDKSGYFNIKGWEKPDNTQSIQHSAVDIIAYKAGYVFKERSFSSGKGTQTYINMEQIKNPKQVKNRKNRLKYLQKLVADTSCGLNSKDRKKLKNLYSAVVAEAKTIAKTHSEKRRLKSLKRWTRFVSK